MYSQQYYKDLKCASLNKIKNVNATLTFLPVQYIWTVQCEPNLHKMTTEIKIK